jgi:lipopolysaccharide biosynthesis regulator YciM
MEFDLQWLLIGLPLAFALGWLAARFDLRQFRRDARDNPRAYFKGLNLLLNEQHDKAIDAFIEAVQNDPDTIELHFALGNLFRRRGEFERAVRVHEHLLRRADLKAPERERAQQALAQDFMKAGLFDRAEAAWRALENSATHGHEALLALLSLYERSRDWPNAIATAQKLQAADSHAGSFDERVAHYECERALEADAAGRGDEAAAALARARSAAPQAARPLLIEGERAAKAGDAAAALAAWDALREANPTAFLLVAEPYAKLALEAGRAEPAREMLAMQYRHFPAVELLAAMQAIDGADSAAALARLRGHLQRHPSLSAAQMLLAQAPESWHDDGVQALRNAVARAARPLHRYRCAACGFEAQRYFWQCPGCLSWDSYPPLRQDAAEAI